MNEKIQTLFGLSPMTPRDAGESHRPATPLELLFDLVSVIAIAAAAAGLHHAIAEDHIVQGMVNYVLAFFMIWLAWMNFTWFASAYDNDDTLFRLLTMVSMAGSLTIAAGIHAFFQTHDLMLILIGFIIMRLAMVAFWLRAARYDTVCRETALWYAAGIALAQVYWVVVILNQPESPAWFYGLFGMGVLLELSVPYVAESRGQTSWHRHHMIERFGLLNIIVLGETLLAAAHAIQKATGEHASMSLVVAAISALVILFSMWWLYFSKEDHLQEDSKSVAFIWGYGHYIIYMSGAAVGAGLAVLADIMAGHSSMSMQVGEYAVAIPASLYLFGLWLVRDRYALSGRRRHVLPLFALLLLAAPLLMGIEGVAAVILLSVIVRSR